MRNESARTTRKLKHALRIEICGGIASGKTTFATLLQRAGIITVLENFQANPFWKAFYQDPARHAFETEITFLLQHYHQIKTEGHSRKLLACDFSLFLDLAYAHVTLQDSKRETFLAVYEEVVRDLGLPDLLVHLRCGAAAELERIRKRGRAVEKSITLEYLAQLNDSVEGQVAGVGEQTRVLTIDSEHQNFADDQRVQQDLTNAVLCTLPKSCARMLENGTELP